MATLSDFRDERLRKLAEIRAAGVDPYPAATTRDTKIGDVLENYESFEEKTITAAGRIVGIRKFGKIAFIVIRDYSGEIQLFLKDGEVQESHSEPSEESVRDSSESKILQNDSGGLRVDSRVKPENDKSSIGLNQLNLLDTGDFIEATGQVGRTKTGEISIMVRRLKLLTKALRPLPTKQDGFTNKEERLRRRYVDMNVNLDVRDRFVRRSKFWQATRDFLRQNDFIEINVPVLEHTTGGADAKAFKTHMDALDEDFYLRISHELPLKRLIGAGFERVYDIGPRFRNEGIDDEHLPEHIAMESYAAYQDYEDGMKLYEAMIKYVAQETWGTLEFSRDDMTVNLDQDWPRIKYADIMREKFDIDVFAEDTEENREKLRAILRQEKREFDPSVGTARLLDNIWKIIRASSPGPFWLIHEPVAISPLAKREPGDNRVTQRFHPIILGTEMGNGFSELNDPQEQLQRFVEQQNLRDAGDAEAMMLDIDFVEMLEYGMPPTCGWGNSERNFWLLEGVTAREGVPFPQLRREIDGVTKGIYGDIIKERDLPR